MSLKHGFRGGGGAGEGDCTQIHRTYAVKEFMKDISYQQIIYVQHAIRVAWLNANLNFLIFVAISGS